MQTRMSEILDDVTIGHQSAFSASIATELSETRERIEIALRRLSSYNIKEEIEPISNFVIKIILTEMARQNIYSKSSIYKWNINVKDVEELARSMAKDNPTRSEVQSEYDAIMSHELDSILGK